MDAKLPSGPRLTVCGVSFICSKGTLIEVALLAGLAAAFGHPWLALLLVPELGSLLAHELGHAVADRRSGLTVRAIVLRPYGAARYSVGSVRSPGALAVSAAGGPLASLVLGLGCTGLLFSPWPRGGHLELLVLALFNLLLVITNLLPLRPLDGQKIMLAFLWWLSGSRMRAERLALQFETSLALLAGVTAVVLALTVSAIAGIRFAVIALSFLVQSRLVLYLHRRERATAKAVRT